MLRRSVTLTLVLAPTWLVGFVPVAHAATSLSQCNNPANSALNQYCETVPSTGGGQVPSGGQGGGQGPSGGVHALATTLPSAVVSRIVASGKHHGSHRVLLTLPAPARLAPAGVSATANAQSLSLWIIVILGVVALGGAVGLAAGRRRQALA